MQKFLSARFAIHSESSNTSFLLSFPLFFYLSIRFCPRFCISALFINTCSFVLRSKIVQQQSHQRRRGCWRCQQGFAANPRDADSPFRERNMLIDQSDTSLRRASVMALSACTEFAAHIEGSLRRKSRH